MKLLGLIASALALDYDDLDKGKNKGSKRPAKVDSFTCGGVAIADALPNTATNVAVSGCLDFTTNEVVGEENVRAALKIKKPKTGQTAVCLFACEDGFEEGTSERMLNFINEERAKKGNKKKNKKSKKKKDKCKMEGNTCNSAFNNPHMKVRASCTNDAWVFEGKKGAAATSADLICNAVPAE